MTQAKLSKNNMGVVATLLFICLLPTYLYRLDTPSVKIWDEQDHVLAAQSYFLGRKEFYRNPRNPPLGKEAIALSIAALGHRPFSYRLPSALSAAALGALLFLAGCVLTRSWLCGLLASLLWASSPLAYLHGRLATLDMMTALFFFAGMASFLWLLLHPQSKRRGFWLGLACLLGAVGGAVKVLDYLLFPLFFVGLLAIRPTWPWRQSLPRFFLGSGLSIFAVLIGSYAALGYGPWEIPTLLANIYKLQSSLHPTHVGLSPWYDWFRFRGELWFLSELASDGRRWAALCTQNPVLWTVGALGCAAMLFSGIRNRQAAWCLLPLAVILQIAFWALFKKQTLLSYGLPMEPIFCLAAAWAVSRIASRSRQSRLSEALWVGCLALASVVYFLRVFPQVSGRYF